MEVRKRVASDRPSVAPKDRTVLTETVLTAHRLHADWPHAPFVKSAVDEHSRDAARNVLSLPESIHSM